MMIYGNQSILWPFIHILLYLLRRQPYHLSVLIQQVVPLLVHQIPFLVDLIHYLLTLALALLPQNLLLPPCEGVLTHRRQPLLPR